MKKLLLLLLLLLPVIVTANNQTNCTINATDIWLNFSLVPTETKQGNTENCYYNLSCSGCGNATTSKCIVGKNLDAGEEYSLYTEACDLKFECEYEDEECQYSDQTRFIDIEIVKENNESIRMKIGDKEKVIPIGVKSFSYVFTEGIDCPTLEEDINASWTYEKCKEHLPRLVDDDKRWEWYSSSYNIWANTLVKASESSTDCIGQLAKCIGEKGNMLPKEECGNLLHYNQMKEKYETQRITHVMMKVALWIESPMLIILIISIFVMVARRGDLQ